MFRLVRSLVILCLFCSSASAQIAPPPGASSESSGAAPVATFEGVNEGPSSNENSATAAASATEAPVEVPAQSPNPGTQQGANEACVPACRGGFVCQAGTCISACNPPCGEGELCTERLTCERTIDAQEREEEEKDADAKARRLSFRKLPRLTLQAGWGVGIMPVDQDTLVALEVAVGAGYRQNYTDFFGLQAVLSGHLGFVAAPCTYCDEESSDDISSLGGVALKVTPFFGPFGRFHIGPTFWVERLFFGKDQIQGDLGRYVLYDAFVGGVGADAGVVLGSKEHIEIVGSVLVNLADSPFATVNAAFRYHFPTGGDGQQ